MKLTAYLDQEQITASQFAEQIGVPPSTITRILSGQRSPRLETIARIERATRGKVKAQDFIDEHTALASRGAA